MNALAGSEFLLSTPWWRWQTIPGLTLDNYQRIAEAQNRPVVRRTAESAFRRYVIFRGTRLLLRVLWGLWFLLAAYTGSFPSLVGVAGWTLFLIVLGQGCFWVLKWRWAETSAADRVVRAVAQASSYFERNRPLDPAETRQFVVSGSRFARAVFAALSGSRWFDPGHPGLDAAALRIASLVTWNAPNDFRSLTSKERAGQLSAARLVAVFVVARDFQGAALVAESAKERDPALFLDDPSDSKERERHFETFGPSLLNIRLRMITSILPWVALFISVMSFALSTAKTLSNTD